MAKLRLPLTRFTKGKPLSLRKSPGEPEVEIQKPVVHRHQTNPVKVAQSATVH